ncbi:MAG: histidine kinase [Tannerella sp.]|jgi:sensor histidine kinase YesM|nr:histidine kinase [Tannerella sp.]
MKNKKLKIFLNTLLFSTAFALLFKWWQTGDPFRTSTLMFGVTIFFIVLSALAIWALFFQKQMARPVHQLKKIIIPLFAFYLVVVLLSSFCIIALSGYIYHLAAGLDTGGFMDSLIRVEFPGTLRYYFIAIFIASAFFFYDNWAKAIDREQQLREENLIYRYRNLKAQVNPHFLFNSLNTLSEIIYVDTRKADHYIHELAGVYRYILDNEETDRIALDEELRFVTLYFNLQKERDGDKIRLHIDFPHPERFMIVPISLQIPVENALKHNSASEENPLAIHICESDGYIVVSNNRQKRNTLNSSHGTGLSNLSERVKLITGKEMIVEVDKNQFIVKLPIIRL